MWIIVGLGNPGADYATSRHNAGFMAVELLATRWRIPLEPDPTLRAGHGLIAGHTALLVQPQTYMNRSGDAVATLRRDPDDPVLVVYDDLDLGIGRLRVRRRGSTAGHRGVESLVDRLGDEFIRIRIGIGRPPSGMSAAAFVLAPTDGAELASLKTSIERACEAVESVVTRGVETTMNEFNRGEALDAPSQNLQGVTSCNAMKR